MNLSPIQPTITPTSSAMLPGQSGETLLDFEALIGQVTKPIVKNAVPKSDAPVPLETLDTPVVTAESVDREIPLPTASTMHFQTIDRHFKDAEPQQGQLAAHETVIVASPSHSTAARPIATPLIKEEPVLPTSKDIGSRAIVDRPINTEAENDKTLPLIKVDTQLPKAVPALTTRHITAPLKAVDSEYAEEELFDSKEAPARGLPDTPVQIAAIPLSVLAQSTTAPVPTPALAKPSSDAPKDIPKTALPVEKKADKILFSAVEFSPKIQPSEPTVTQFSLQTSAPPPVAAPTTLNAPLFATPDSFTTHQLDLARDTQWIDQLTREIVSVAGQDGKLRFSLAPDGLGHLEVMVETQQDGVKIQFQTSTENAAKIFAAEQPKLLEELRQSGVRVANSDLMAGHQMQGQRDHSRAHTPAWLAHANPQNNASNTRQPSAHPNTSLSGRFA